MTTLQGVKFLPSQSCLLGSEIMYMMAQGFSHYIKRVGCFVPSRKDGTHQ